MNSAGGPCSCRWVPCDSPPSVLLRCLTVPGASVLHAGRDQSICSGSTSLRPGGALRSGQGLISSCGAGGCRVVGRQGSRDLGDGGQGHPGHLGKLDPLSGNLGYRQPWWFLTYTDSRAYSGRHSLESSFSPQSGRVFLSSHFIEICSNML